MVQTVVSYELLPIVAETRLRNERKRTYNTRSIPTAPRSSYNGSCFDHGLEGNLVKLLDITRTLHMCLSRFSVDRRVLWEELQGQYSCKLYVDKESPHVNDHDYNVEGSPAMSSLIYIYTLRWTGRA